LIRKYRLPHDAFMFCCRSWVIFHWKWRRQCWWERFWWCMPVRLTLRLLITVTVHRRLSCPRCCIR